jgi:hypothetical protein
MKQETKDTLDNIWTDIVIGIIILLFLIGIAMTIDVLLTVGYLT